MNSTTNILTTKHNLKIKNTSLIEVGLDIGGSLTKIAVSVKKEIDMEILKRLKNEIEFMDHLELEQNIIFFILLQTANFVSEGIDLLKSKLAH
jgi:hypothetical protein